jgi:hypothetical protein
MHPLLSNVTRGLSAALLLVIVEPGFAKDYGVFVDGSFNPGAESELDRLIDKRIDDAKMIFDGRNPPGGKESWRVDSRTALTNRLCNIQCGEGDTITLMMMGHGMPGRFVFSKAAGSDRRLTDDDLLKAIRKATMGCKCKVYLAVFSCYSGSMMKTLFMDPHVQAMYTSCRKDEKSTAYSLIVDGQFKEGSDWLKHFNEDWMGITNSVTNLFKELQFASETAKSKLPAGATATQHPQGWRKGEQLSQGHIELIRKRNSKITRMRVHFWEPEFARCKVEWVDVGDNVQITNDLAVCDWIQFDGTFGDFDDRRINESRPNVTGATNITEITPPTTFIKAHVVAKSGNILTVDIVEPKSLAGQRRRIRVDNPGSIDADVDPCTWIFLVVTITDPTQPKSGVPFGGLITTTNNVEAVDELFNAYAHVKSAQANGRVTLCIQFPHYLRSQGKIVIQTTPAIAGKLGKCTNIVVDLLTSTLESDNSNPINTTNIKVVTNFSLQDHYYPFDSGVFPVDDLFYEFPDPDISPPAESKGIVFPHINVYNAGEQEFPPNQIECVITQGGNPVYMDMQQVPQLGSNEVISIVFTNWAPRHPDIYDFMFQLLNPDDNHHNNRIFLSSEIQPMPPIIHSGFPHPGGMYLEFNAISPPGTFYQLERQQNFFGSWQPDPANPFETPFGWGFDSFFQFGPPDSQQYRVNANEP